MTSGSCRPAAKLTRAGCIKTEFGSLIRLFIPCLYKGSPEQACCIVGTYTTYM